MVDVANDRRENSAEQITEIWDNAPNRRVWKWVFLTSSADALDAYFFVASSLSIIVLGNLIVLGTVDKIYLTSFFMIGIFSGAILAGKIADAIGRKTLFRWDMLTLAILSAVIGIVVSQVFFLPLMFGLGFLVGADVPTAWTLTAEFSPKNKRAGNLGLGFVFWVTGAAFPYWVIQLSSGLPAIDRLHLLFWIPAIVAFLLFVFRRSLVESPRWLLRENKTKEAEAETSSTFGVRNENHPSSNSAVEDNTNYNKYTSFSQFVKSNYRIFFIVMIMYLGVALFANTFALYSPFLLPKLGITTFFAKTVEFTLGWSLPQVISLIFVWRPLYERNRKLAFYTSSISSTVAIIALLLSYLLNFPHILDLAFIVIFLFLSVGIQLGERVWSSELWPTSVRSSTQGEIWGWRHFPLIFWGVFIFPALDSSIGLGAIFGVLTAVVIVIMVVGYFLPDYSGKSLEQIEQTY